MEVLEVARQVRQRNIRQQSLRHRVDLRNGVVGVRSVSDGIENLHRLSGVGSRGICGLRKVSLPLQQRRDGRELVERIRRALAVVIDEIKSLATAVVDMGDVQRSAHGPAEAVLLIRRLFRGLAGKRKRRRIQRRISDAVIDRSMRTIDIKTAPAKTPTAEPAAPETASLTTESAATPESTALLAGVVETLLHFVRAHGVERVGSVSRNSHGFRRTVRRNPWNRHSGRRNVAHRSVGRILSGCTLKYRKTLKTSPARVCLPRFRVWLSRAREQY